MQRLAREFNFSETTFVLPPSDPSRTCRVRIPEHEAGLASGLSNRLADQHSARCRHCHDRCRLPPNYRSDSPHSHQFRTPKVSSVPEAVSRAGR